MQFFRAIADEAVARVDNALSDRAENGRDINDNLVMAQETQKTLGDAITYVHGQVTRAQGLSVTAYSIQGASSQLGANLQRAMNDLLHYENSLETVKTEVDKRTGYLAEIAINFHVPRIMRENKITSSRLAEKSDYHAGKARTKLGNMVDSGARANARGAVVTVDNADSLLNRDSAVRKLDAFPRFDQDGLLGPNAPIEESSSDDNRA